MTRRQVKEAYRKITLSTKDKEDVLNRILSASLVMSSDGRDIVIKKKSIKPVLIAAIIVLMVLLMGCAWVVMKFDDLVIGEKEFERTHVDEGSGELITEPV